MDFKELLKLPIKGAKKSVKVITDKQLSDIISKLEKFSKIAAEESNRRFTEALEDEAENEIPDDDNANTTN